MSGVSPDEARLADILARYAASFEDLRFAVRLIEGFALVPVECADVEIGRALARWLGDAGYDVELLSPRGDQWLDLAPDLERLGHARKIGGRESDPVTLVYGDEVTATARRGLGFLNQRRDVLGRALRGPLLWCGPSAFLEASWTAMPDMWSVRTLRLALTPSRARVPSARLAERLRFREGKTPVAELASLEAEATRQQDWQSAARLATLRAEALAASGRWAEAERAADAAMEHASTLDPRECTAAHSVAALIALHRGDLAKAEPHDAGPGHLRGAIAFARGDFAAAEREFTAALDRGADPGLAGVLLGELGDTRAQCGRLEEAGASWSEALKTFERIGDDEAAAVAEEALGEIAAACDRVWEARRHLRAAASRHAAHGAPGEAARLGARLAELGEEIDPTPAHPVDARRLFRASRVLAKQHRDHDAISRRLADLGVEPGRHDLGGSPELAWSRLLGSLARSGHTALDALLAEVPVITDERRAPLTWIQIAGATAAEALRPLLEDATARAGELGPPDAVFVLGDLASSQPESARDWLVELCDAVGIATTGVFVIPGPRDCVPVPEAEPALTRHRRRPLYMDEVLRDPDATHRDREAERARRLTDRALLWRRLAAFGEWSAGWGHPKLTEERPFWTASIGEVQVIGLDSVLLSASGDDGPDTLALGMSQLEALARLPAGALVIALCHHAPNRLADGTLLSGLLSQRPHLLLDTGEIPTSGAFSNRVLGEVQVRSRPEAGAPGYAWGRLDAKGLTLWHRRWNAATGRYATHGLDTASTRSRADLPEPLDRWLPGPATPAPAPLPPSCGGADFDPARPYVDLPFVPQDWGPLVGREGLLEELRARLFEGPAGALGHTLALVGMGGLGKTRVAFEYAQLYQARYPGGVYVLHADGDVEGQLIRLGERARWVSPLSDRASAMQIVSRRIRQVRDGLIVFDNLDDLARIRPYLPPAGAHLLVTSRAEQPGFPSLAPTLLDPAESLRLLTGESRRAPDGPDNRAAMERIARRLAGLPLALELVAAWMRRHPVVSWREYERRLEEGGLAALRSPAFEYESATGHLSDLRATLRITEGVFVEAPVLRQVLDLLAWSGPGTMTIELLSTLLEGPADLRAALDTGLGLRILHADATGAIGLHRLVAEVRRGDGTLGAWAVGALRRMGAWFEARRHGWENLGAFEANAAHLAAWELNAAALGETDERARLAWMRAKAPRERGLYADAEEHVRRALATIEEPLLRARIKGDLAGLCEEFGRYVESRTLREEALAVLRERLGEEDPETAEGISDVASVLASLGQHREALSLAEAALVVLERESGETRRLAECLGVCGQIRIGLGQYREALALQERALAIRRDRGDSERPEFAGSLSAISQTLNFLGRSREALDHAERAVALCIDTVGDRHPRTGDALLAVGRSRSGLGDYEGAIATLQRAQAIFEGVSPTLPGLDVTLGSLGTAWRRRGDPGRAVEFGTRSLDMAESLYGPDHPEVGAAHNNLGLTYGAAGDPARELALLERALDIARRTKGDQHPDTATNLINVGMTRTGPEAARGILDIERGVGIKERTLGLDHPHTYMGYQTLGAACWRGGRRDRARPLLTKALAGLRRLLGDDHPSTVTSCQSLGVVLCELGKTHDGIELLAEALTRQLDRLGPAHPDTLESRLTLAHHLAQARRRAEALKVLDQGLSAVPAGHPVHTTLKTLRDRIDPPVRIRGR